MAPKEGAEICS